MAKRLYGIRGATCVEDTRESITKAVREMCAGIFAHNGIAGGDIVSVHFSVTGDITALNPATALRQGGGPVDVSKCALFCSQEPGISGMMARVIRVLVTAYMEDGSEPRHVYLNGAEKLRPDFAGET